MQVYYMKKLTVKTKQKELDYEDAKILGIDYAMHGMAVFSEDIQKENEGYFRKVRSGWQGNKESYPIA